MARTMVLIAQSGNRWAIETHREKRTRVHYYFTDKLTLKQVLRLRSVLVLRMWEHSVELAFDLSPVVELETDKPVFRRNRLQQPARTASEGSDE